jgi:hypothetical protein
MAYDLLKYGDRNPSGFRRWGVHQGHGATNDIKKNWEQCRKPHCGITSFFIKSKSLDTNQVIKSLK